MTARVQYTDAELEKLLVDVESDLVERKEAWRGDAPDKGRQAVCAFANDRPDHRRPGVLFVGVNDDGAPTGPPVTDELLRALADIRTDGNTLPPPSPTVEKRVLRVAGSRGARNAISTDRVATTGSQRDHAPRL
jgi:ATP-dependent DNA helicase RecG